MVMVRGVGSFVVVGFVDRDVVVVVVVGGGGGGGVGVGVISSKAVHIAKKQQKVGREWFPCRLLQQYMMRSS